MKTIITALLALVTMTGQAQSRVHYRLEGFIGDSTVTGKALPPVMMSKSRATLSRNITSPIPNC